jgi:Cu-Zn family superoxide dismutase
VIKTRVLLVAVLAAAGLIVASPGDAVAGGSSCTTYRIPGNQVFPEGIAVRPGTHEFFVGSSTDGTIFRGRLDRPALQVFLPGGADGRTSATGMKVDQAGRLFIAGADTGRVFVYDIATRQLIRRYDTGSGGFLNDIALTARGAFVTDSFRPTLYFIPYSGGSVGDIRPFVNFNRTVVRYQDGFNINGIVPANFGRYLFAVQTNTGQLFRIQADNGAVVEVDTGGTDLTAGDGVSLQNGRLFVVRNAVNQVAELRVNSGFQSVSFRRTLSDPCLAVPTTSAVVGNRILVVNSQFNASPPALPFTVASLPI